MTEAVVALRRRLQSVREDWHRGRRDAFPLCCITMFCWDSLWLFRPSITRTVAQGVEPADSPCEWVPCGVWHHGGSSLSTRQRAARIAGFWFGALGPRSSVWGKPDPNSAPPVAPWRPAPVQAEWDEAKAAGLTELAWAGLDAIGHDPELEWT